MNKLLYQIIIVSLAIAGIVIALPVAERSEEEWMLIPDSDNNLHYVNLKEEVRPKDVKESDISFDYYSRNTNYTKLCLNTVSNIIHTDFNPKRNTMFIIHGWLSTGQSIMNKKITSALLETDDWNVFNVDWGNIAVQLYPAAKSSVPAVAEVIAKFIQLLKDKTKVQFDNLYLTGHSLGAHIAGGVGSNLNDQVGYIVGLDPAYPLFDISNREEILDHTDAKYVQVIHTDGDRLGIAVPTGHSDFYPNGGKNQTGCINDFVGACAHSRAYLYFAESIRLNKFLSYSCDNYNECIQGNHKQSPIAYMGGVPLDTRAKGIYYLKTGKSEPFGLN